MGRNATRAGSGTRVTLRLRLRGDERAKMSWSIQFALNRWCRHVQTPIYVTEERAAPVAINVPLSIRAAVWHRITTPEIKQPIYDLVLPQLAQQAAAEQIDPMKAFPAPPGMKEWRAAHPEMKGVGTFGGKKQEPTSGKPAPAGK